VFLGAFEAGKLGEYICASRLMKLGVSCEVVNLDTVDIVAYVDQRLIRIQVKSSVLKNHRQNRSLGYQFATSMGGRKKPLTVEHCDIVALVATDCERVLFKPVECLKGQVTKRILPRKFDRDDLEYKSWHHCMDYLNQDRQG
jgi:hypothetical protein